MFSSSAIRAELAQGEVQGAADMLGHWWRVTGKVVAAPGAARASASPRPTSRSRPGTALAHGIYAVRVLVDGQDPCGSGLSGHTAHIR